MLPEGLGKLLKFNYSGFEPATFWLVAQSLNHLFRLYSRVIISRLVDLSPSKILSLWLSTHFVQPNTVALKNGVFWDVTPCGSCKNRRFGGT
jgi:hypothetical protein